MLKLDAIGLSKSFGDRTLFEVDKIEIFDGDRIGLVGLNGAGKTTLLHILAGEIEPDTGRVRRSGTVALIRQMADGEGDSDPAIAGRLGVASSPNMSGGERTRAAIAAALSQEADILLCDEPTTNLDLDGIEQVEGLLIGYPGAVVLISHDRELLDAVCTQIWEIEAGTIRRFPGGYSDWTAQKERERQFAEEEYMAYRAEQNRLSEAIRQVEAEAKQVGKPPRRMSSSEWLLYKDQFSVKQKRVQGRSKAMKSRLARMPEKQKPAALPDVKMGMGDVGSVVSRTALRVSGLTVAFAKRVVLNAVHFELPTGKHAVLTGPNGSGKTTLVRAILGGDASVQIAAGVKPGYFAQGHETLRDDLSILENVRRDAVLPLSDVMTILARLGLRGEAVHKPAGVLSGGERAKVQFAMLLSGDYNLLILDEPTNHIDIVTAEALETLLAAYRGTLLLITHDRRLRDRVGDFQLMIENGTITAFAGSFADYQAEQRRIANRTDDTAARRTVLELRIASVTARMAQPKKGDSPDALEAEWRSLLDELRALEGAG